MRALKKLAWIVPLVALSSCSAVPNLGTRDVLRGKVSPAGENVRIAVYSVNLDAGASVVKPDSLGSFSYEIPYDAQAFQVCAFSDVNGNGRYDEGEPSSKDNSYLVLTKVGENWEMSQHAGGQVEKKNDITSADLSLQG